MAMSAQRRGLITRTDLLQLRDLVEGPDDLPALAAMLGYHYSPVTEEKEADPSIVITQHGEDVVTHSKRRYQPHLNLWYVKRYQASSEEESSLEEQVHSEYERLPRKIPVFRRELTQAGIQGWLDALLTDSREGSEIDLESVVQQIAKNQPLAHWPYLPCQHSMQEVLVFVDYHDHLSPVRNDYLRIYQRLRERLGPQACRLIPVNQQTLERVNVANFPEQSRVLLFSDLGTHGGPRLQHRWCELLNHLKRDGHSVRVLSPCALSVPLNDMLLPAWRFMLAGTANAERVHALVCALAFCHYPNPDALRFIRQQLPHSTLADELAVWNHEHAQLSADQWQLLEQQREFYRRGFLTLAPLYQAPLREALRCWQQGLPDETQAVEQMLMYEYGLLSAPPPVDLFHGVLGDTPFNPGAWSTGDDFLYVARESFAVANKLKRHPQYQRVYHRVQQITLHTQQVLPLGPRAEDFPDNSLLYFNQQYNNLVVSDSDSGAATIFSHSAALVNKSNGRPVNANTCFSTGSVELQSDHAEMTLSSLDRPAWAAEVGRNRHGVFAQHEQGAVYQLHEAGLERSDATWVCVHNPWSWASETGIDDYGVWATIEIGNAQQRMRWIDPGDFMMGSPTGEPERVDNETEHAVCLTQGYWLADTACTQAFWLAVMGDNPSKFTGESDSYERPVERVSWDDCQRLIEKLNTTVSGLEVRLPTDAEWEYACRAGTCTPFSTGNNLTSEQANFNGQHPYHNNDKGKFRMQTTPVKTFPANDWGFYDMHGNVWEWCQDWYGPYDSSPVVNPTGPESGEDRVLRGGSWFNGAGNCRSAYRSYIGPGSRGSLTGFRLAQGQLPPAVSNDRQGPSSTAEAERRPRGGKWQGESE